MRHPILEDGFLSQMVTYQNVPEKIPPPPSPTNAEKKKNHHVHCMTPYFINSKDFLSEHG